MQKMRHTSPPHGGGGGSSSSSNFVSPILRTVALSFTTLLLALFLKTKLRGPEATPPPHLSAPLLQQFFDVTGQRLEPGGRPSTAPTNLSVQNHPFRRTLTYDSAIENGENLLKALRASDPCDPNSPVQSLFTQYADLGNNGWVSDGVAYPFAGSYLQIFPMMNSLGLSVDRIHYSLMIDKNILQSTNSEGTIIQVGII